MGTRSACARADFDEEALHTVVPELQAGDSAAFALTLLQFRQEAVGVAGDGAQAIELLVMSGRDDTAVAQKMRGLGVDRAVQQCMLLGVVIDIAQQPLEQRRIERFQRPAHGRQRGQRGAQLYQIPGPGRAQCNARLDTLEVADRAQLLPHRLEATRVAQGRNGVITLAQLRVRAQRPCQRRAAMPVSPWP